MLLLLLHHIAGDGWSLAPLARDLSRFYAGALPRRAADLPAPAGAICRLHAVAAHGAGGGERDAASAIARQLGYWTGTLKDLPGADRAAERPAAAGGVELSRGSVAASLSAELHGGCWSLRGRAGRACSWCCRPGLRRC